LNRIHRFNYILVFDEESGNGREAARLAAEIQKREIEKDNKTYYLSLREEKKKQIEKAIMIAIGAI
jgi:hypothetical protein